MIDCSMRSNGGNLKGTNTTNKSRRESNANKGVLHIPTAFGLESYHQMRFTYPGY